ncbi:hypothetical protein C0Q70_01848 [Pomacea canaliculata]|uniref:Uncharacterized protein n=1 Tax=Pomacea canaliculata TaxID=400727 RepID=A0A2T7Q0P6_POMCA|nr:hypothetical protein C0Q70_01848 [Pomacea canaliculata]
MIKRALGGCVSECLLPPPLKQLMDVEQSSLRLPPQLVEGCGGGGLHYPWNYFSRVVFSSLPATTTLEDGKAFMRCCDDIRNS